MDIDYWLALSATIPRMESVGPRQVMLPTDLMLDSYQRQAKFRLPAGYVYFIKLFGPGELAWSHQIKAPGYSAVGPFADLLLFNTSVHNGLHRSSVREMLPTESDLLQLQRLVFFSETTRGKPVGWDPLDVQDEKTCEYGIYMLTRDPRLIKIADSFRDYIEDVCLPFANINIPGWNEEERGPRLVFSPVEDRTE